jgi:predicted DNA-binding protein with PD1-like motif
MKWKQIDDSPRRFALVFAAGDDLSAELMRFATENNISDASFTAIGALSSVKLAWLNPDTKKYNSSVNLNEQVELLSMIGDVFQYEGKPMIHAHLVVGRKDGETRGGHLLEAVIHPTCELFLDESPYELHKKMNPEFGLPMLVL